MAKSKINMTTAERETISEFLNEIAEEFAGESLEVETPITVTVKYENGQFKKKPLAATQEFFPTYAYMGVSGALIFGFAPADTQEWEFIELKPEEVDEVFPLFGSIIATKYGIEGEEKFPSVIKKIAKAKEDAEAERARKEAEEARAAYENIETFGMF